LSAPSGVFGGKNSKLNVRVTGGHFLGSSADMAQVNKL
jgi:hypothetical protein